MVVKNKCESCPAGKTNVAGDDASAADTTCKATFWSINAMVVKNKCESCPIGKTNVAWDDASAADKAAVLRQPVQLSRRQHAMSWIEVCHSQLCSCSVILEVFLNPGYRF